MDGEANVESGGPAERLEKPGLPVTAGRVVMFVYDEQTAMAANQLGGNIVRAGDEEPAMVVKVWDPVTSTGTSSVNLKVFRDGPRDFWVTSVVHGEIRQDDDSMGAHYPQRTWHWPVRV